MRAALGRPILDGDAADKEPTMQTFDRSFPANSATVTTAPARPRAATLMARLLLSGLTGAQLSRLADLVATPSGWTVVCSL
jgi:hypothetical protein